MSGLELLLLAKGIALVKAHFAVAAVHTATTTAAAHVPAAVAHKAAIHVAQTGVQAAASATTATQAATTLASTAGLAYGIASQGGGMVGSAQRKLGRHGIGNPGPTIERIQEDDEMDVDQPMRFPEPAWTAWRAVEENQIENEKPTPQIPRRPVPAQLSPSANYGGGQRQVPGTASSNRKGDGEQQKSQHKTQYASIEKPNEMTLEDQPYSIETHTPLEPNNAKSTLDFNGKVGRSLFLFFRVCEIVLTLTNLGFIASSMSANGIWTGTRRYVSINGGSVFALLVTLWSLGFVAYRIVMTFKPALDRKVVALAMETITILLVFGGAMGYTFAFSCYVRPLLSVVAKKKTAHTCARIPQLFATTKLLR